ncbi:pyridoxamine 5'-phosphate oxidase family protein [Sphingomonas sp. ID1715]|uniref:pyridoxamine 5'-phosphate oxidase family protein n=1 Tax=Sphingomonas sp. ID1715 TaxID=1656898 RepID=UPI0014887742|nr:pyridoxamine 5'-phosphate oxidase family protein [Sphingomonas sp. ID1715]NNM75934.1 pyridoxamine 5'-phosphate oxidase family protein [Sphingomonas sp. ID1715]
MATEAEITEKFWKALKSDMTVMLGVQGVEHDKTQPMTAQTLPDTNYIWFFTTKDNGLVAHMRQNDRAIMTFASKGHDLFATVDGRLELDNDRSRIDQLWSPFAAAWYEGGKDDPNLQLVRLDPVSAQIWLNENSAFAGLKSLLGRDPKKDYQDKVAEVAL